METCHVLLLEDNPGDARLIQFILDGVETPQYTVFHYQRLQKALEACEQNQFQIALVDLTVPDSSGIETVSAIIQHNPHLPVIVLTGMLDEALGDQAVQAGAQDFLIKGEYDQQLLVRAIAYAISRQAMTNALQESDNRTRKIIESNPDGIVVVGENQVIQFANPTARNLLDDQGEELEGTVFGFPCRTGAIVELKSAADHGALTTVEMHSVDIDWRGKPAKLLSLRDITQRVELEERLRFLATHDPLTGIPNRAIFEDHLNLAIRHHHRYQSATKNDLFISLILLDLDEFKQVNDTYGHPVGDELLVEVAMRLMRTVREVDTVARFGGDEFVIIAENLPDCGSQRELILRIMHTLNQPVTLSGHEMRMTASIGVSCYPDDGEDYPTLLKYADIALYRAKRTRNRCCFYNNHIPDLVTVGSDAQVD